jgi:hypothetical protein
MDLASDRSELTIAGEMAEHQRVHLAVEILDERLADRR